MQPLIDGNPHRGCATMACNSPLGKCLMCAADPRPCNREMNTHILDSSDLCGPWGRVTYMSKSGEQGGIQPVQGD